MRALFILVCSLASAAGSVAAPRDVTKRVGRVERTDCPPPWCEQVPTIHRLGAPDDPSVYLGDVISYEAPSDWRDFAPLRDKVSELTDGLTSDLDKVIAIADWVKHSKVSAPPAYATWPPTIIDIWGFPNGQCEEASFLLTAMLRFAAIPAMRFTTWNNDHAVVRAFVGGRWVVVDATPIAPDNSGPATVYAPDDPSLVPAFQERPVMALSDVEVPGTDARVASFTLFADEPVDATATLAEIGLQYGTVAFPVTNKFLYYDPENRVFASDGPPEQRVTIMYRIDAVDALCLNDRQSWYASPLTFIHPGLLWRTINAPDPPEVGLFYPIGYIETILPTCGTWRIVYTLSNQSLDTPSLELAYEEFRLDSSTDLAVIRPESLQPADGADMTSFRALVGLLEDLPTFEQLVGVGLQ
ncbi:MAG TPA: transglutaminase-like domain-containing protein [Thermoanaerobaculaceae bacterium]|nr:transglutaminase-like domain-containing protein [Thermoanaerobaculaceae bacterium]